MRPFIDVTSRIEDPLMRHAAALALRARGATAPNPLVGCVVVSGGRIVGEGHHPLAGEPHAEVFALADAGERARDAHVYVTLEPCTHHGRTPPCTDALIAAGVARVTIGMPDPSAQAGGGARVLREAGIEVEFAEDPAPYAELNRGWLKRTAAGLPWVTAKVGLSLDAAIALEPGVRSAMTGPSGARVTQYLRSTADAVLVGAATVEADDPALTVRDADGRLADRQPMRIVLAGSHVPPLDARVFADGAAPTLLLVPGTTAAVRREQAVALASRGVQVIPYEPADGLTGALRALGHHGVNELLVEPGSRLMESLWRERALDELVTVTAGGMGGSGAAPLYRGPGGERSGRDSAGTRSLEVLFSAVEAGIVGDVSVTVWRPYEGADAK